MPVLARKPRENIVITEQSEDGIDTVGSAFREETAFLAARKEARRTVATVPLPEIRVGQPRRHGPLAVFPLFLEHDAPPSPVEYQLAEDAMRPRKRPNVPRWKFWSRRADEALTAGTVVVSETSGDGSVGELLVENKTGGRILLLEGEELAGAKQNRILNTSVLIAAGSRTTIPVSCVEMGRWALRSRHLHSSGFHSPPELRRGLKASVYRSLKAGSGHRSDQRRVWCEVARQQQSLNVSSNTGALSDSFVSYKERLEDFGGRLAYVDGAAGIAVSLGDRVVVDLFDKPSTCRRVWHRLLSGPILDAVIHPDIEPTVDCDGVSRWLDTLRPASWDEFQPVGEGKDYRTTDGYAHASMLSLDGTPIHTSAVGRLDESK